MIARSGERDARLEFISPPWPAPSNVHAGTTTRVGGTSAGRYATLNLGDHVGDDPDTVGRNRAALRRALALPAEPLWLKQVHGVAVVDAATVRAGVAADGSFASRRGLVCAVLHADCLPIFLCNRAGTRVALLHAGWRGLAAGVIEAGVRALRVAPAEVLAAFGPAISAPAYEVGDEVRARLVERDPAAALAFAASAAQKWFADLYALARLQLEALGVRDVHGVRFCTARQPEKFFSYRRDGVTGRMASLIWLT